MRLALVLVLVLALVLADALMASVHAQPSYEEDNLKAAFLLRFAEFVQWPAGSLPDESTTLKFGIAGADAVAGALSQLAETRSGKRRPIAASSVEPGATVGTLHVLFVSEAQNEKLPQYLAAVGRRPVLVVTNFAGALERGSMINFVMDERRMRFEISLDAADAAGLRISSRLLSLAAYVKKSEAR